MPPWWEWQRTMQQGVTGWLQATEGSSRSEHRSLERADGGNSAGFGDATFHGSMGGKRLNQPVVGISADNATGGYVTHAAWSISKADGTCPAMWKTFGQLSTSSDTR